MKKRVFSMLLALVLALSAVTLPAGALGSFTDVSDQTTARNAEVLRLLGVVDGTGGGSFDPNGQLRRAEFCKMTVELLGLGDDALRYQTMTIFPDVRASHWASGYINLAVRQSSPKLLSGMPDGTFQPDRSITYAEAVTILMRVLGYTDADSGGVWPAGYLDLAAAKGVSAGVKLSANASLTRAQAAQLFVNALGAETKAGKAYVPAGCTRDEKEVTLVSLSGSTVRVSGGSQTKYDLVRPSSATVLNGLKGYLLTNKDGKVETFIPTTDASTGAAVSSAAVILSADKSTDGLSALTGGRTDFTVYRNGVRSSTSGLRKNDVATYDASTNTLYVCDTRVAVYYESCSPSPAEPASIEVLGGTVFEVLPTAQQSLANFKPGKTMTLLLTSDGAVAGAVDSSASARANAVGIVSSDGKLQMFCGSTMLTINGSYPLYSGKLVGISSAKDQTLTLSVKSGGVSGDLDVRGKTLGSRALAENVLIYDDGMLRSLSELTELIVPEERILYARTNASGQVDLIAISETADGTTVFGRVSAVERKSTGTDMSGDALTNQFITIDVGGKTVTKMSGFAVSVGDFVEADVGDDSFPSVTTLTKFSRVRASSWVGTTAVSSGGRTYSVPSSVLIWNRDTGSWFDGDVDAALAYGGTMNLYAKGNTIRAIELGG